MGIINEGVGGRVEAGRRVKREEFHNQRLFKITLIFSLLYFTFHTYCAHAAVETRSASYLSATDVTLQHACLLLIGWLLLWGRVSSAGFSFIYGSFLMK